MDIDEALNKIIFKYHLDKYYPHYRNMYEAEKILRSIVHEIIENKQKAIFVGENSQGIEFVQKIVRNYTDIQFFLYPQDDIKMVSLEEVNWKEYEQIYIISFYGAEHVKRWYRLHNICYQWIYDIFEEKGFFLQKEFFVFGQKDMSLLFDVDRNMHIYTGYEGNLQCELYCQNNTYENTNNNLTKRIALVKCLFLTLYMRNFIAAKEYASLLSKDNEKFRCLWEEVQELLNAIKDNLKKRQQKDIILYWLDTLGYGDEIEMPYLQSIMSKSIMFENAYTCVLYTNPTLRTLFLGKKDMDDRTYKTKITWENSPVMQLLGEESYDIKIISGMLDKCVPMQCTSKRFYQVYDPASMKLWEMLVNMLKQKQKTLYIVHCMDSHGPYLSCKMRDDMSNAKNPARYRVARLELDRQLAFYDTLLHEEAYRIYMSDHGRYQNYHVLFNIYHKTLKPRKIDGMFSYLDFYKVLRQMIADGSITESEFTKGYVEIGFMDFYNACDIGKMLKKRVFPLNYFGYTGIIDKEYVYLHYSTGKEWLQKRSDIPLCKPFLSLFYNHECDICEPELLPRYRELAGEYPADIIEDEQFRYSRYLYALYYNIRENNDIGKQLDILNELLSSYPENSVVIRMGGAHSEKLYHFLTKETKRKIWGFIDNSDECICSKFHLPIVRPTQIEELKCAGVKAVLLSSFKNLDELRDESKSWGTDIDVIDIYDCFEKNGIICKGGAFYNFTITDADWDVGFPFEEVKL